MRKRSMLLGVPLAMLSAHASIASKACSDLIAAGLFTTEDKESWRRRGKRRGYRGR